MYVTCNGTQIVLYFDRSFVTTEERIRVGYHFVKDGSPGDDVNTLLKRIKSFSSSSENLG